MNELIQDLPAHFSSFYLFDEIGKGGMAEIFLAKTFTELGTDRLCVIKRILPELSQNDEFIKMLIGEAKLCAQLSHANVVQTYDLGQVDGQYFIAMEYVEGFDLNRLLGLLARSGVTLPLQFALYIIGGVLSGLEYAHNLKGYNRTPLGIIHRDVSPTNVLISTQAEIKLCDFGIAKATMGEKTPLELSDNHLKGKVAYMAPEHLNNKTVDSRSDIYSCGILLWELLSGRRLYKRKDESQTLELAKKAMVPPLANRNFPEFEKLKKIVDKALAPDPEDRFYSATQFLRQLDNYMHDAKMLVSQIRFSDFINEHFGRKLIKQRRERERNLARLIEMNIISKPEENKSEESNSQAEAIMATFSLDSSSEDVGDTGDADSKVLSSLKNEPEEKKISTHPDAPDIPQRGSEKEIACNTRLFLIWTALLLGAASLTAILYYLLG